MVEELQCFLDFILVQRMTTREEEQYQATNKVAMAAMASTSSNQDSSSLEEAAFLEMAIVVAKNFVEYKLAMVSCRAVATLEGFDSEAQASA